MDISTVPLPGSLASFCTIGTLRDALKYRSREAMGRNWIVIFPGQILPEDHQTVEPSTVMQFVTEIAKPQRGRPGSITGAAQSLLKTLTTINDGIKNFRPVPENIDEPVLMSSETKTDVVENIPARNNLFENIGNRFLKWLMSLTKLDVVYWVTLGIADYGLTFLLKEMGIAAAIVYTLISLHALDMAKNRKSQMTAQTGIVAVWCLEIGSFAVHLTMFNRRLWSSIDELPFRINDIATESRPFYISLVLAFLFSAAGIYAVSTTLSLLRERIEADNYEKAHGEQY